MPNRSKKPVMTVDDETPGVRPRQQGSEQSGAATAKSNACKACSAVKVSAGTGVRVHTAVGEWLALAARVGEGVRVGRDVAVAVALGISRGVVG